jgi:hypothetical protein
MGDSGGSRRRQGLDASAVTERQLSVEGFRSFTFGWREPRLSPVRDLRAFEWLATSFRLFHVGSFAVVGDPSVRQ